MNDCTKTCWPTSAGDYNSSYVGNLVIQENDNYTRAAAPPTAVPPDQKGTSADNQGTEAVSGGPGESTCPGLPVYSVNTSYLNLAVEDTDFAWQSFGHSLALRRVWNEPNGGAGMFGNGWTFAYESTLRTSGNANSGTALITLGSGQIFTYNVTGSQGQGSGTLTVNHAYSSGAIKPVLTGYLSEASGTGYYTYFDKNSKLTSRYDYVSTNATSGEKVYRLSTITDRNGNALTMTYDASGRLSKLTDASNRMTTFGYDANNRCTLLSTFNGKSATFEYDASGNLVRNVDLAGTVITYAYDANKLITSMTAAGKTTGFTWFDLYGEKHVGSLTDANGKITKYEFVAAGGTKITEPGGGIRTYSNSGGLTTSVTDPLNNRISTAFTSAALPSSTTDALGRVTRYEYDASGNITKLTDPAGKITTFTYDANWNLTKRTDSLGNSWTYTYDTKNNLIGITSPLGLKATVTVDSKGLATKLTGPDGSYATSAYDSNGNSITIANQLGKTTTFGFDGFGLELTSVKDPKGNTTAFSYDPNRLLTSMTLPDNSTTRYSYACNALTSSTDGGGNTTTLQRDNLLKVTKVTNPLGKVSTFAYNSDGFKTAATDPLGRSTAFGYDAAHDMTSITDPLGQTILFSYNPDGSLASITNERGKTTTMSYDTRGLLAAITDPLGTVTTTPGYDALGRITSVTNGRGHSVATVYDTDGRITEKKYDTTTVATYSWNTASQLSAVTDSSGVKTFTRNAAGQITTVTYPDGLILSLTYDNTGNVSTIGYPGGLTVNYSYDALNRTSGVTFGSNAITLGYSAAGNLTTETRSNGVTSSYGYDAASQFTSLSHKKGATVIADLTYTRNDAGLPTNTSGSVPLAATTAIPTGTGTYNNADGVLTWNGDTYSHDADGNLTAISGSKTFSAVYDNQNRPTSITNGTTTTAYQYDGLGNRVKAQTATTTRTFHHDPWGRLLFETDSNGTVTANYIYAGNRLAASGTSSGGFVFYLQDKTGNTLALTDASGTIVGAYAYSPYGAVVNKSGTATTPFTYVGAYGVMDEGSNLYFMENRYYDADTGRFIQRDPIGFAGGQTNLYAYVGGNPVTKIDSKGLREDTDYEVAPEDRYKKLEFELPDETPGRKPNCRPIEKLDNKWMLEKAHGFKQTLSSMEKDSYWSKIFAADIPYLHDQHNNDLFEFRGHIMTGSDLNYYLTGYLTALSNGSPDRIKELTFGYKVIKYGVFPTKNTMWAIDTGYQEGIFDKSKK
jgi:RHS repeat-associated protein